MQDRDQALIDNQCKGSVQQKKKYMEPLVLQTSLRFPLAAALVIPVMMGGQKPHQASLLLLRQV